MLLTEEQARKTRCCGPYDTGFREPAKGMTVIFDRYCVGSECMAWDWHIGPPTQLEKAIYQETSTKSQWCGYCGLAGKAET